MPWWQVLVLSRGDALAAGEVRAVFDRGEPSFGLSLPFVFVCDFVLALSLHVVVVGTLIQLSC